LEKEFFNVWVLDEKGKLISGVRIRRGFSSYICTDK